MKNENGCKINNFLGRRGVRRTILTLAVAAVLALVCAALASCGPAPEPDRDKEKPTVAIISLHTPDAGERTTDVPEATDANEGEDRTAEPGEATAAPTAPTVAAIAAAAQGADASGQQKTAAPGGAAVRLAEVQREPQ